MPGPFPPGNNEDDPQKRCRIDHKRGTNVRDRDDNPRQSRPNRASEIKFDTVEGCGSCEIFLRNQLWQHSPPGWAFDGISRGKGKCQDQE